jgi:hypothetical protein
MGKFVFTIPKRLELDKRVANTVHVIGLDGIPWPCKISYDGQLLSIHRNRDESGHVYMAYALPDFGELVLSTGTLVETDEPYHLTRELARGTLNRLRNQLSLWEEGGLEIDVEVERVLELATDSFGQAVSTSDVNAVDRTANQAIELATQALFRLCQLFGEQVLPYRLQNTDSPRSWIGVNISEEPSEVVKRLKIPVDVVQVSRINAAPSEPCELVLGPFLDASPGGMKDRWAAANSFEERQAMIIHECRAELQKPLDRVKILHVVSGINGMGHRHLSYPQQLQVTIDLLQLVENMGIQIPTLISFDTPWAEKLAWSVGGVHPLQIADSLLRRGVCLSMLGLDINLDYWPNGSLPRDPCQWLDLVDLWSQLGLPLVIRLTAPSQVIPAVDAPVNRSLNAVRGSLTDEELLRLLDHVLPVVLSRPMVHGIIWGQLQDGLDPRYPFGGVLNIDGHLKPIGDILFKTFG